MTKLLTSGIICFFCLISQSALQAQEKYRILYDYNTEAATYLALDNTNAVIDTLTKPRLKRNSLVEIKLVNVNPFAVDVIADIKEEDIVPSGSGFNFTSLLGGISGMGGDNLGLNVSQSSLNNSNFFDSASRGTSLSNAFTELSDKMTAVRALENTLKANLLNPNLDKEAILQNVKALARQQADARLSDPDANFYLYLSNLDKIINADKQQLAGDLETMATQVEAATESSANISRGELVERNRTISNLEALKATLSNTAELAHLSIDEIRSLYTQLEAASFERTYDYQMDGDEVNINLKFVQSSFSESQDTDAEVTTIKTRSLKLFATGGFKINSSVALTLNNFGDKSKDFFISEEGVIGATANDYFIPNLSTMINFYPVIGDNFNVGGSFGLSIPLADDITGVNFLLGPSIFLGSKSRLSLSGGVAYGPVDRLTDGLEAGQTTSLSSLDNFTKKVYDFGYFFGISFSLFDIN
ncbi:hypothetical protein [Leeuwenhoekiella nanhaiensis]|uniref:DUF5723 domain-containing protein n=1 Tax=Leeuwenhoekiella nanhaiensis TaxID=1655491 RepID=A0A2G1VNS5_9FLAO|nr:hypothetical protein [Leeuwenhoekiella nanhaiensis]PHQ28394.1 hypothetical protein CJ305_14850 [Leeuwenhoekiella nanhaiensis]